MAATVGYGDRVNFLDAVGGQPAVEDDFDYDVPAASQITFASGVKSTSPGTDHPGRNIVVSEPGWYLNALGNTEPNASQTRNRSRNL
ncbi:hypothetical protein ABVF61_08530 [Roseibium sp. HPY-6]|uniref:hypothetical protein n=1 Tax=Roseibium sp. HPY-6 TaxID=3229852 RepID=UPI00339004BA